MARFLALVFAALAAIVLAGDLWSGLAGEGPVRLGALGEWWFWLHPSSLQVLEPAIARHVAPWLWDPVMQTLLLWPLAVELAAVALALWAVSALARRRASRRRGPDLSRR